MLIERFSLKHLFYQKSEIFISSKNRRSENRSHTTESDRGKPTRNRHIISSFRTFTSPREFDLHTFKNK